MVFYNFSCATDKNFPTGLWNIEVRVVQLNFIKVYASKQ